MTGAGGPSSVPGRETALGNIPLTQGRSSKCIPNNAPAFPLTSEYTKPFALSVVRGSAPDGELLRDLAARARGFASTVEGIAARPDLLGSPQLLDQVIAQAHQIAVRAQRAVA